MPIDFIQSGADVKAARRRLGLSIPEFARLLGVTPSKAEAMERRVQKAEARAIEWLANEGPPDVTFSTDLPMLAIREALNLSQSELGFLFDTDRTVIQRWEYRGPPACARRAMTWLLHGFRPGDWPPRGERGGFQNRNWLCESRDVQRRQKVDRPNKRAAGRQFLR